MTFEKEQAEGGRLWGHVAAKMEEHVKGCECKMLYLFFRAITDCISLWLLHR